MDKQLKLLLIARLAERLGDAVHIAVGASSPIPAAAALLAQHRNSQIQVSLLGAESQSMFTDGGRELFDCAAQGRIDYFFFSGVQIDGQANINLVGRGDYPHMEERFAGSFGSAYLYHQVPKVILFCWAHSTRTLVDSVDFISAAGPLNDGVWRRGGPIALLTDRCEFSYQHPVSTEMSAEENMDGQGTGIFKLISIHPGESKASIAEHTGFDYQSEEGDIPATTANSLDFIDDLLNEKVLPQLSSSYPRFVNRWAES